MEVSWGEQLTFPSTRGTSQYTHLVGGRYPCRSTPLVPRMILRNISREGSKPLVVLDPFMGSGTTAIEAKLVGASSIGLEVDPYARLVASVACHSFSAKETTELKEFAEMIERQYRKTRFSNKFVPEIDNIDHWFPRSSIEGLARIKRLICESTDLGKYPRMLLLSALGDVVRGSSRAERQSLKPYISKRFPKTPGDPLDLFGKAARRYLDAVVELKKVKGQYRGDVRWIPGDATAFTAKTKADIAITSPPYINAIDYVRCIKLESLWVGTSSMSGLAEIRRRQLGENKSRQQAPDPLLKDLLEPDLIRIRAVDKTREAIVLNYFHEIRDNLTCVYDTLRPGGSYFMIIGDSVVRGVGIETHRLTALIAESIGFAWNNYFRYQIRDHRTSLQRGDRGGKISVEHVIELKRMK